jgi:hypothetical protein
MEIECKTTGGPSPFVGQAPPAAETAAKIERNYLVVELGEDELPAEPPAPEEPDEPDEPPEEPPELDDPPEPAAPDEPDEPPELDAPGEPDDPDEPEELLGDVALDPEVPDAPLVPADALDFFDFEACFFALCFFVAFCSPLSVAPEAALGLLPLCAPAPPVEPPVVPPAAPPVLPAAPPAWATCCECVSEFLSVLAEEVCATANPAIVSKDTKSAKDTFFIDTSV